MSTPQRTAREPADQAIQPTISSANTPGDGAIRQPTGPGAETPIGQGPDTRHRWWLWVIGCVLLAGALIAGVPWVIKSLNTVSTDDAYVNGHVTFVAPRVAGQVARVLVDDNNRVRKGDLL